MSVLAGIDIGGTKCAVSLAQSQPGDEALGGIVGSPAGRLDPRVVSDAPRILERRSFSTPSGPAAAIARLGEALGSLCADHDVTSPDRIGISCGGPLDSRGGLILSPPNLPGWDRVDVVSPFQTAFHAPVHLQNDANAGALAEWLWGAGRGLRNVIFLTFGTGMGAGLILDGRLYAGTNDLAGEVGHLRLAPSGPFGYGKRGSFEGFCSGGGIARLAAEMAERAIAIGKPPQFARTDAELRTVTAERVAEAARAGDSLAGRVFGIVARRLGDGLALLVDILNPEMIIIGSIFGRQQGLLENTMRERLQQEALEPALSRCRVVPAGLAERVGDFAALAVAASAEPRMP